MIPFAAALSKAPSTLGAMAASPDSAAPLKSVFKRLFTPLLRSARFSDWRTHFSAALIFGTASIITGRSEHVHPAGARSLRLGGFQQHLSIARIAALGDLPTGDGCLY